MSHLREPDAVAEADISIVVDYVPEHHVYAAWADALQVGHLDYKLVGERMVLLHTKAAPEFQRHGVATELIGAVLEDARRVGRRITVICPAVCAFLAEYPQYEGLLDPTHPGVCQSARPETASPRRNVTPGRHAVGQPVRR
jgi:predicted GNAT family acetyltransferase